MKKTIIEQISAIKDYIYQVPYDELTDYLKGIRDMTNLLNGEEQGEIPLCDTVFTAVDEIYTDLELPFLKKKEQKLWY